MPWMFFKWINALFRWKPIADLLVTKRTGRDPEVLCANSVLFKWCIQGPGKWRDFSEISVVVQLPSRIRLLWPHGLQHARPPCPSPSLRVCPSSCALHQWCHATVSSSVALFSLSFPWNSNVSTVQDLKLTKLPWSPSSCSASKFLNPQPSVSHL